MKSHKFDLSSSNFSGEHMVLRGGGKEWGLKDVGGEDQDSTG